MKIKPIVVVEPVIEELVHYQIKPDSRIENTNVERLAKSLCTYQSFLQRVENENEYYRLSRKNFISFEMILKKNDTKFFITTLARNQQVMKKSIESTWNKSTIEDVADPLFFKPNVFTNIEYEHHYMFSMRIDYRKQSGIMENLLETLNIMKETDQIYLQIMGHPASKDWYVGATEQYKKFKEGKMPKKRRIDKKTIAQSALMLTTKTMVGLSNSIVKISGGEPEEINLERNQQAIILKDGALRRETLQKTRGEAFDTEIRIGVVCGNRERAESLKRISVLAFREFDGDNYLIEKPVNEKKMWKHFKERTPTLKIQKDYFSVIEFSRLLMLPTGTLQEQYHIPNINTVETELPQRMLEGGLLMGYNQHKGNTQNVYFPTNNHDELCLPHAVVGGMGQGKTKGYGANRVVQAVLNGFGALCLDPAKGELGDEIVKALKPDQYIRINLGIKPIAIDWRETKHAVRSRNRLANTIISFFSNFDETGGQTVRFLRASVFGMQTSNLKELLKMFEDEKYLTECIEKMPEDSIHKQTLQTLLEYGDGRRRQILDPIYNRLDDIIGDEYLAECFDATEGLDMVTLMSQRKAIIIDVPQSLVGDTGVNLIGNLIMTKINLAMTLRSEQNQFPFFVIIDEPHQFTRSQGIWKTACVESRKWRVQYTFMFHDWAQLNRDLRDIMKSAGSHFTLYPSSKKTFMDLSEEMTPLTLSDGLALKTHHSINILTSGKGKVKPFIMKMTPPPSQQKS
jgi:hypothetical protein